MTRAAHLDLDLPDAAATERFGAAIAPILAPGDTVLLEGPLGAGKSHLIRNVIQSRQAAFGDVEDIPSPTYTIVQEYSAGHVVFWHADLYRVNDSSELDELGLYEAIGRDICLIEWPDRLGSDAPQTALRITLSTQGNGRRAVAHGQPARWAERLFSIDEALR